MFTRLSATFDLFAPETFSVKDDTFYRLRCHTAGLFKCKLTKLMFKMGAAGEVEYRSVQWGNLLKDSQWKPAGPLYDLKCSPEGTLVQLHLPHCEILSEGTHKFLCVAHVKDSNLEIIKPTKITETHAMVTTTGLSLFGLITEFFKPRDIQGLVVSFLQPRSELKVLLLASNVDLNQVKEQRAKLIHPLEETYLDLNTDCILNTTKTYSLSTDSKLRVVPETSLFAENNRNFTPAFTVHFNTQQEASLILKDDGTKEVWKSLVNIGDKSTGAWKEDSAKPSYDEIYSGTEATGQDFFQTHKGALTSRLPLLGPILIELEQMRFLNSTESNSIQSKSTPEEKNATLLNMLENKGTAAQNKFFQVLQRVDPHLVEDLIGQVTARE